MGTVKLLTLFRPATGEVWAKPVEHTPNAVLHPWLRAELTAILDALSTSTTPPLNAETTHAAWAVWQAGLTEPFTLPSNLPPLRALLVWDNLAGHKTTELVCWLCAHGVMPLYTPLGGSWLNMAESIQRIVVRRALAGQHPESTQDLKDWLAATVRGWNAAPTPFEWGGETRRSAPARPRSSPRSGRLRRVHPPTYLSLRSRSRLTKQWPSSWHLTH